MKEKKTVVVVCGKQSRDSCGYCKDGSSCSYGILSDEMNAKIYEDLLNIGWRRCGTYYYKPTMHETCCPQYTIRLKASKFQPTKSQKKTKRKVENVIKQMITNTYNSTNIGGIDSTITANNIGINHQDRKNLIKNDDGINDDDDDDVAKNANDKNEMKKENEKITSSSPLSYTPSYDGIRVVTEKASFSSEKFQLYKQYQVAVHHDEESDLSEEGFTNFLINSSLFDERNDEEIPQASHEWGTYHQCYYIKDQLVAVGVLDFLPSGLSSVYCFYDPNLPKLNLGKFTALKEIEYCVEHGFQYYYMGFYIHTCTKMKYKGDYSPSELLCPTTLTWQPLSACLPKLDAFKFCPLDERMFEKFSQRYFAIIKDDVEKNVDNSSISIDDNNSINNEKDGEINGKYNEKREEDIDKDKKRKKKKKKDLPEEDDEGNGRDKLKGRQMQIENLLTEYAPQFFKESQLPVDQAVRLSLMRVPLSINSGEVLFFQLTEESQSLIKSFIEEWIGQVGQMSEKLSLSFLSNK